MVIGPKTIHRLTCKFTYGDTYKNLTLITDANTGLTRMSYDLNGNVLTVEDPANRTTTMTFDGKNRMLTTADALSETTTMAYYPNGTLQQVTDALGRVTTFFYTPTSRLAKIHDALGQDTLFHYDGAGNLLSVQDPNLNVTGMVYDAAGKMIQVNQPDTYQVEYVFNAINRLVAITTPNGNLTDAASTNLQGSKNILRNPSMEVDYPYPSNNGARYWEINPASREPVVARSTAQAHSGSKSLYMFESAGVGATSTTFYQNNISTYAGGRYLASVWAAKAADSVTATFTLSAALRDYYSNSQVVAGSDTAGGVVHLDGTSTNWAQSTPLRVDVPGDTQATLFHPPVVYLSINGTYQSSNTPSWLDDAALNSLSTCFEYDGENLREVGSPDGGRTRMEYDRFGRLFLMSDPIGRTVQMTYDGLDRLLTVTDSLGQTVTYTYDQTGQLTSVQDPKSQVTSYGYDLLDRLHLITYPDSSTEIFNYNTASDLLNYTDNMSRLRSFGYDTVGRLSSILYGWDNTSITLTYDAVSNLIKRQERNTDSQIFSYDSLNRQNGAAYTVAGATTDQWALASGFDANGNRNQLQTGATVTGAVLNGTFQTQSQLNGNPIWSVPASNGFDSMNRLKLLLDGASQTTSFGYDSEGRRLAISQPNGCSTTANYDIVGKLLGIQTLHGSSTLLNLNYNYNLASDRLALQTDQGSYDYHLDESGRLVQESVNCFNQASLADFSQGILDNCLLDTNSGGLQLLSLSDTFNGSQLNCDRWSIEVAENDNNVGAYVLTENNKIGLEIHQKDGLYFVFPKAFANQILNYEPPVMDNYDYEEIGLYAWAQNRQVLQAPIDIAVDFSDIQGRGNTSLSNSVNLFSLVLSSYLPVTLNNFLQVGIERTVNGYAYSFTVRGANQGGNGPLLINNQVATTDTSGSLRLQLSANGTVTAYYSAGVDPQTGNINWVNPSGWNLTGFTTANLNLSLQMSTLRSIGSGRFLNLRRLDGLGDFSELGSYTSCVYDAGQSVNWNSLKWNQVLPANTGIGLKLAVSNSPNGPWAYLGPDDMASTSYVGDNSSRFGAARFGSARFGSSNVVGTSGNAVLSGVTGRYARYQVQLTSADGLNTPTCSDVQLWFSQTGMLPGQIARYGYDLAGNILTKTTLTPTATTTDVRTVNNLNQVLTQAVRGANWTYSYNLNGALTGKTNGTDAWIYTFNDEDRLTRVQGPNSVDVSYHYDSMGRMISRTSGSTVTLFSWSRWDCVAESTAISGTVTSTTTYVIPGGQLYSFGRDGVVYQIHMDAQGSVRMVTDSSGTIVMRAEYDGWGGVLSVTDNVPGGMPYRFVGALGVRWDPETQLLYMRQRWYDSSIQRWISRDPVRAVNRYIYSNNNPSRLEDPMGLTPNSGGSGCVPPGGEGGHVQMGDFGMPNNSTPADILKIFKGYQAIVDAGTPNGICEEYAKLTFNFLRKLKKQGFLKGYHPWIYGWDLPATSNQQMKSAPSINRLGYSTTDYTHNFAVLVEDSTNKVVLVLDPWETGQLMSDSPTVWYSLTTYRRSRVFMNLMYGDIKPWTDAQVRHEAVDYNPYCSK